MVQCVLSAHIQLLISLSEWETENGQDNPKKQTFNKPSKTDCAHISWWTTLESCFEGLSYKKIW